MVKKHLFIGTLLAAAIFFFLAPTSSWGINIAYPGYPLKTNPFNVSNSLFPGASLSNNEVTVTGGTIGGDVDGGVINSSAAVSGNQVLVSGAPTIAQTYGGRSNGGDVSNNVVVHYSGTVTNAIIGGRAVSGTVSGNGVTIYGGSIATTVRGGWSDNGPATSNTVYMDGGSAGNVVGGYSNTAAARGNTVTILNATANSFVRGGWSNNGSATGNTVTITGATAKNDVLGGYSVSGAVSNNSVRFYSGTIAGDLVGGRTVSGSSSENGVTIHGGSIAAAVYGGWSDNGPATSNTVYMGGGSAGNVVGGYSDTEASQGNTVTILNATANSFVRGGWSNRGPVTGNIVIVDGATAKNEVLGGYSVSGAANANSVSFYSGNITGDLVGGRTGGGGQAVDNRVRMYGGTANNQIFGGHVTSGNGSARNNVVEIFGGNIPKVSIAAGYTQGGGDSIGNQMLISGGTISLSAYGGLIGNGGSANNNIVELRGGTVGINLYGGATAPGRPGNTNDNMVIISDGRVAGSVYGGATRAPGSLSSAEGNQVLMSGGVVGGDVTAGRTDGAGISDNNLAQFSNGEVSGKVYGGYSVSGSAKDNAVDITKGTFGNDIYGSFAGGDASGSAVSITAGTFQGDIYGNSAGGDASNGTVSIGGGVFNGDIYGNSAGGDASGGEINLRGGVFGGNIYGGFAGGDATNNIFNLATQPKLANTNLYGGMSSGGGDAFTGNTLNVLRFRGPVQGIQNFENYNFFMPSMGNGEALIEVLGPASTDMNNTTVSLLGIDGGLPLLKPGDKLILISKANGMLAATHATNVPKGIALLYDFDVYTENGSLVAKLRDRKENPDSGILPHGPQAGAKAAISYYAELVSGLAAEKLLLREERKPGPMAYAITIAGSYHYTADSSPDISGAGFLAGLDWRLSVEDVNAVLGVFFETGMGDYDSSHQAGRLGRIDGDGDTQYYGGGIMGFVGWPSGLYLEGSLRAGMIHTSLNSDYTQPHLNRDVDYDLSQPYYGAHTGVGWLWRIKERSYLDVYTKYFWLREEKDETTILREKVNFDAIDVQRWRTGARFAYDLSQSFTPYVGAAYEYEFSDEAKAKVHDFTISADALEGGTVIGELGCLYKSPGGVYLDLTVKGFDGEREGVAGRFMAGIEF